MRRRPAKAGAIVTSHGGPGIPPEQQDASMPHSADTPPPLPRSSAYAAIVGPRENLPPIYRNLIERLARETIPENTRRALESDLPYLAALEARRHRRGAGVHRERARGRPLHPRPQRQSGRHGARRSPAADGRRADRPRAPARARHAPAEHAGAAADVMAAAARGAQPRRPFGSPALRSLLARARAAGRAVQCHAAKKSAKQVDRNILDRLVATRAPGLHSCATRG